MKTVAFRCPYTTLLPQITVTFDDGESVLVWSGLKKGPPRKLKFPEASQVIASVNGLMEETTSE